MPPTTHTILRKTPALRWRWAIIDGYSGLPLAAGTVRTWREARTEIKAARRRIALAAEKNPQVFC